MLILTRKFNRPSTDVQWYVMPDEGNALFLTKYKDNVLYRSKTLENNGLTLVVQVIWDSRTSYEAYNRDPDMIAYFRHRKQYNRDNSIEEVMPVIEDA